MAVRAVRLDERHRRRDPAEQALVDDGLRRAGLGLSGRRRFGVAVRPVRPQLLEQPRDAGMGRDERGIPALEERAPFRRDRLGVLEVLVE
jgi:hypothetical protein